MRNKKVEKNIIDQLNKQVKRKNWNKDTKKNSTTTSNKTLGVKVKNSEIIKLKKLLKIKQETECSVNDK